MAQPAYTAFFATSMGAAAALLGLLFVAVSIAPERTFAEDAPVERQIVATSAFTALVNAFFVSMAGSLPDLTIGIVAFALGCASLLQTTMAAVRLWEGKLTFRLLSRRLGLIVLGMVIYLSQIYYSQRLLHAPSDVSAYTGLINPLFAIYGFALVRCWELLGARHHGLASQLRSTLGAKRNKETDEAGQAQAAQSPGG